MLIHFNAIACNENLEAVNIMLSPDKVLDYYNYPFECWKWWFGVEENGKNEVTRANNNMLAPGIIYKKKLHDLIGLPDLNNFLGAADFEYWSRILFNKYKCKSIPIPSLLYRQSVFSTSNNSSSNIKNYIDKIKEKYYNLYENKKLK